MDRYLLGLVIADADAREAALEAYRPGVEMVPIEAFVEYRPEYERPERPWLAVEANRKLTWHPDKPSALAAVRESVRKVMAEREAADE